MIRFATLSVLLISMFAAPSIADEDGFVSMFNGKDLTGWEGRPGTWKVEEGAITGESTKASPCQKTHYLYWSGGEPENFVMRFDIKLVGGNSGVQFRSEKRPDFDTWGYQADFDATNQWTGCLFQHDRGAVVLRGNQATISADGTREDIAFAKKEELAKLIKDGDWNRYEIVARGSEVTLLINGEKMCQVDDQDAKLACKKGIIAVQMHKGEAMKVQFKNLRIKMLE
jgi:hypothetical protein